MLVGESNLYSSAIKIHSCVSVDFFSWGRTVSGSGWNLGDQAEVLGDAEHGGCLHVLEVGLEAVWVLSSVSRSADNTRH